MSACALLVPLVVLFPAPSPTGDATKRAPSATPLAAWVRQLGDERFARREAASRALADLGELALPALRKAAASPDPEVRKRAATLMRKLWSDLLTRELARLKGTWRLVDEEIDGANCERYGRKLTLRIEVESNKAWAYWGSGWRHGLVVREVGHPDGSIDLRKNDETWECLYRFEAGRLHLCWREKSSTRPGALRTKRGDGCHLMIFQREEPIPPSPEPPAAKPPIARSPPLPAAREPAPIKP